MENISGDIFLQPLIELGLSERSVGGPSGGHSTSELRLEVINPAEVSGIVTLQGRDSVDSSSRLFCPHFEAFTASFTSTSGCCRSADGIGKS